MATSPEEHTQDQSDFADAYNNDVAKRPEPTEDEAFGLTPEAEPAVEAAEPSAEAAAESGAEGAAGDDMAGAAPAVVIAIEPAAEDNADAIDAEAGADTMSDKDIQRQKSWEGRLKAKEKELQAREDAMNAPATPEAAAPGEAPAEEVAEPQVTEAIEEAVAKVESGEMTADQAMATLTEDFGPDFTKMLHVLISAKASEIAGEVAGKTADEKVAGVSGKMDTLVADINDDKARGHFEALSDVHPDFLEVGGSPEFKEYVDALDETQKADAEQVIERGSARQIIKLLSAFKTSKTTDPKADADRDDAMSAAEGVRSSGGIKIPDKPSESQGYEEAWKEY